MDILASYFVAVGAGLFFMWPLRGVLGRLIPKYFTLFRRVPGAMQQACFPSSWPIVRMACISCLALVSADRLGAGMRGGFSPFYFPDMTGTVGVCPRWIFISVSDFVDFLCNFHYLEYFARSFLDFHLKVPAL